MGYKNYHVPRGTIEKYIELLLKWNDKVNLVSIRTPQELIDRHILDSLQLINYIEKDEVVFDVGSGAGFPGLMLSYAGIRCVNLIEKINKKCNFLILAAAISPHLVKVYNQNVATIEIDKCDVITARGFASLENILEATQNLNKQNTRYLLLKGKNLEVEIKKALENWQFEYILIPSQTSNDSYILELKHVKKNEKSSKNNSSC